MIGIHTIHGSYIHSIVTIIHTCFIRKNRIYITKTFPNSFSWIFSFLSQFSSSIQDSCFPFFNCFNLVIKIRHNSCFFGISCFFVASISYFFNMSPIALQIPRIINIITINIIPFYSTSMTLYILWFFTFIYEITSCC